MRYPKYGPDRQSPDHRPISDPMVRDARRWLFVASAGGMIALSLLIMLFGPLTVWSDNSSTIGIAVVALEILIVGAGLAWLVLLMWRGKSTRRGLSQRRR